MVLRIICPSANKPFQLITSAWTHIWTFLFTLWLTLSKHLVIFYFIQSKTFILKTNFKNFCKFLSRALSSSRKIEWYFKLWQNRTEIYISIRIKYNEWITIRVNIHVKDTGITVVKIYIASISTWNVMVKHEYIIYNTGVKQSHIITLLVNIEHVSNLRSLCCQFTTDHHLNVEGISMKWKKCIWWAL